MKTLEQKLAESILKLTDPKNYHKFSEGYFKKAPKLSGYIFNFNTQEIKVYLILNTSNSKYNKEFVNINNFYFIVYDVDSLNTFINNVENNLLNILKNIKIILDEGNKYSEQLDGGLPYGYFLDNNGNIRIDVQKANEVKKIFKIYPKYLSIRDVAKELKTNFSHIHDVLYDDRYGKMKQKIVSEKDLKKVKDIIYRNRKNKVDKERKIGAMLLDKDKKKQMNTVDKNKKEEK